VKSYRQRCPLARALDVVGDRWALLVVRELSLGPRRYTDLAAGLPGIGTNVLATRLAELQDAGVITRESLPPPTPATVYRLTDAGWALRPALDALRTWGAVHGRPPADGDALRPGWLLLRLVGRPTPLGADDVAELAVDDDLFTLTGGPDGLAVRNGPATDLGVGLPTDPGLGSATDPGLGSATDPGLGSATDPGLGSAADAGARLAAGRQARARLTADLDTFVRLVTTPPPPPTDHPPAQATPPPARHSDPRTRQTEPPTDRPGDRATAPPTDRPGHRATAPPTDRPGHRATAPPTDRPGHRATAPPIEQPTTPGAKPADDSINGAMDLPAGITVVGDLAVARRAFATLAGALATSEQARVPGP
jgi:DNA-binding HxlR family transcriptional regulator